MTADAGRAAPVPSGAPPAGWRLVHHDPAPIVVWRRWILRPPRRRGMGREPVLSGTQGYPWWEAMLEAKCTRRDRDVTTADFATFRVDRYHRVIPDADCTCGIYAHRDELALRPLMWGRSPVVSGFVELTGRRIETHTGFRSQYGRIVGPLCITLPPPPPLLGLLSGRPARPHGVLAGERSYRVLWKPGSVGLPLHAWEEQMRRGLAVRYGAQVVAIRPAR